MEKKRQPCDVEPPNRIDKKACQHDTPGLFEGEQLEPTDGLFLRSCLLQIRCECRFRRRDGFLLRLVSADQGILFFRQPFVTLGGVVDEPPCYQPDESECPGNYKGHLPVTVEISCKSYDQWRRDNGTNCRAAVEYRHAEGALPRREPHGNRLCSTRPIAGFAETENESECAQATQPG